MFNAALQQISEATVILDEKWKIKHLNNGFYKLFGYDSEEIIGHPITILNVPTQEDSKQPASVIEAIDANGFWKGEVRRRTKNGDDIQIYLNAKATFGSTGKLTGYIASYFDLREIKHASEKLSDTFKQTIEAITLTVEARDPYTAGHSARVAELSAALATKLDLSEKQTEGIRFGASIFDLGKIFVPGEILTRPGKLTDAEFEVLKDHSQTAYDILKGIDFPWPIAEMVLQHHERLDGSGYPNGLKGDEIIIEAKILAIADVLEAMNSHRPYRSALGIEASLEFISLNKETLFSTEIVDACVQLFNEEGFEFSSSE
jgi:PAS domain S-box-containing protein